MDLSAFDLKGKVALITGGAHGIGFSIAEGMAKCGAAICFNCSSEASLEKGMAAYKAAGIEAHGYVADVSDEDAVSAMVAKIKAEVGPVDILVNNAGITRVVHQDIHPAKGGRGGVKQRFAACGGGNIGLHGHGVCACGFAQRDGLGRSGFAVAVVDHHVHALFCQCGADGAAVQHEPVAEVG